MTPEDLVSVSPGWCESHGLPEELACMSPGYVAEHYDEIQAVIYEAEAE